MKYFLLLLLSFFLVPFFNVCHAQQTFNGKITYLTSTTAYVNLGTNQGFDVGDTLRVTKNGKIVAQLQIATIASKSLSAAIISKDSQLREGDDVTGFTMRAPKTNTPLVQSVQTVDTSKSGPSTQITQTQVQEKKNESNVVRGRLGLQYYAMINNSNSDFSFSQPAAVLSVSIDKLFSAPLSFNFYSNTRYDARSQNLRIGVDYPRMTNRIYEASLKYGNDSAPFTFMLGRFVAPVIGGVGTFDGAMATTQIHKFQFGFAAGSQPGWKNSDVQLNNPKFAAFVNYQTGDYSTTMYQGSVAYAQQYFLNSLDRGFLYMQNTVTFSNSLSIYQNADFDMHDVGNAGPTTSLHLSDLFLSASYRPLNWMSTSASYAIRRNIYFLESFKNIPDSLFDKSFYQNMQVSVGFRLPFTLYLTTTGSLRKKDGDIRSASSLSANLSWADILSTQAGMYINGSIADNIYNKSNSIGIDIHRDIIHDMYFSIRANRYSYNYSSTSKTIVRTTVGSDIYYRISKTLYATLSYERYFEDTFSTDRIYTELSYRL